MNSGKGDNNRRNKQRFSGRRDVQKQGKPGKENRNTEELFSDRNRQNGQELSNQKNDASRTRLRWTAPVLPANPITTPECPWCKKQITDITTAINDRETGLPVHFDCVLARIRETEPLEPNDSVCYIGGGRFGIVHYGNPSDTRDFTIKKIFEWEERENHSEWRRPISEYFSIT